MINRFSLSRHPLSFALASAMLVTAVAPAHAQEAELQPGHEVSNKNATNLDKVTVTGSRIKRAEVEGPAPVTVISSAQIEREGFTTVFDALNTLTQASGSTQNEIFQGGFTPNASVINLRGLGPGRTLLLINGRRAADYPLPYNGQSNFANFGNIPAAAVERIELLAGGASAIYGSDAVAGVVNIVLKTNFEGDLLKVKGSTTTDGGRDRADLQWIGGKTGDKWSVTYAVEYFNSEPLHAFQRDFMDSLLDNPLPPDYVGIQPTGTMRVRDRTKSANSYIAPPPGACEQFGDEWVRHNYRSANAAGVITNLGQACGSYKDVGYQTISNGNNDMSAYLYGTFDFDSGVQAWASLQTYWSRAKYTGGTQFWGGPTVGGLWYDQGLGTIVDAQRVFTPQEAGGVDKLMSKNDEKSYDFAVGFKGNFGERFDWDATLSRAEYRIKVETPRLIASKINDWFLGQRIGTRNGYAIYDLNESRYYSALTPEQFASMSTVIKTDAKSYVNQGNFVVSGDLFELPAGPLGFAAVVEASQQEYELNEDPRILPDYTGADRPYNRTGTGGGGKRDRYATGVELSVPIFDSLKASIAGRLDKYDDITAVDDARTWNAGLEWRPFSNLLVRGSYATSFRAPDMHYVFAERSGSYSSILDVRRCLESGRVASQCPTSDTTTNYTAFGVRQGTKDLREETGKSWTAGFVWDIIDGLSISADYYHIELEDVVSDITSAYILEGEAGCITGKTRNGQPFTLGTLGSAFCNDMLSRVSRLSAPGTPNDGQITEIRRGPINRAVLGTKGIDATLDYRLDTDRLGDFRVQVGWSHTLGQTSAQFKTDPVLDYRDDLGNFDFRSRIRATGTWQRNDWQAALFMIRYGSLPNWQETGRIAPYFIWNGSVGKKITDKAQVNLYVNNMFDNHHPRDDGFNSYPYFWRAFDAVGREVAVEFQYRFR
ncbi:MULTISPECIES: TonB-dependent siderophore receptor [Gammaproteobacteria]|uniref:TonB-dependent receptor plug domain-containing protein n=1 Tax=Gammaproteobacteria TaxID=1236 RepID=UPI00257A70D1|nr:MULTISPECIES: TonB-dependent receptor [Gammaproteobacteria]